MNKKLVLTLSTILLVSMAAADMEFRSSSPIDVYSQFNMHSNPITNLEDPDADGDAQDSDALTLGYANSLYLQRNGDSLEGYLDANDNEIRNLPMPDNLDEAATKRYVDSELAAETGQQSLSEVLEEGSLANQSIDMDSNRIQNLPTPSADTDAATKGYVDSEIGSSSGSQNLSQVLEQGSLANQSIDMDSNDITNLETPDADSDAATQGYVLNNYLNLNGDKLSGNLDMDGNSILNAGSIDSPVISGQLDLNGSKIVNVSQPDDPQDVVTLEYFNQKDSKGSDNQTLTTGKINGEDTNLTIQNGNSVTINDYFEADTNAETRCSSGQVLTGSGCVSQYSSSDDGDTSTGNEGVNSVSFDTSTGDLTLGREHRTSLTQNLDGRYITSDTNAGTICSTGQVLNGDGDCISRYSSSDDGDTSDTNEIQDPTVTASGNEITVDLNNGGGQDSATISTGGGTCPSGYVKVPGSTKRGTEDFCVMKYEAKDDGGDPVSQASSDPWGNIDQYDARKECRSLGSDYHLITESEWMTIADNLMRQEENWADGNIGSKASNNGGMYLGNVDPSGDHSHLGYDGANPESGTGRDTTARLQLSNGNYIWDFSGNVWEWTNGYMTTDGVPEPDANGWTEYTDITKFQEMSDEKPLNPSWNASNGIGRIYLDQSPYSNNDKITDNIHAVLRGGSWLDGAGAGALSVGLLYAPSHTDSSIGFRCVAGL